MAADGELLHEGGLRFLARCKHFGEVDARLAAVLPVQLLVVVHGHSGHEVILVKEIFVLVAELHGTDIKGIMQNARHELVVDFQCTVLGMDSWDRIAAFYEVVGYLFERFALNAHPKHVLDELVVLPVGAQVVQFIFPVAMFEVTACPFAFCRLVANGAGDVLRVLVAVLLRHDERNAKKHFARRVVVVDEVVGELDVLNVPVVEHVDYLAAFLHVAGKAVRCPRDDALVAVAVFELVEHGAEKWATVGHHGRLFLVDDVHPPQAEAIGKLFTLCRLVGNAPLLLFRRVGAFTDVYDVPNGFCLLAVTFPVLPPKSCL
jgi:hypothetical protein